MLKLSIITVAMIFHVRCCFCFNIFNYQEVYDALLRCVCVCVCGAWKYVCEQRIQYERRHVCA